MKEILFSLSNQNNYLTAAVKLKVVQFNFLQALVQMRIASKEMNSVSSLFPPSDLFRAHSGETRS